VARQLQEPLYLGRRPRFLGVEIQNRHKPLQQVVPIRRREPQGPPPGRTSRDGTHGGGDHNQKDHADRSPSSHRRERTRARAKPLKCLRAAYRSSETARRIEDHLAQFGTR
jgi:hypothetical protein